MMNKHIMRQAGFEVEVERVEHGKCPTCNTLVKHEDFKDRLSIKEFHISGMCQRCQDETFGEEERD